MAWTTKLGQLFNGLLGIDPRRNADGTMTTKHGNRITPYRISATSNGGLRANVGEFMFQPRVWELMDQMKPLLASPPDDVLILHPETGNFYLNSEIEQRGIEFATVLGQIDLELEESLFKNASQRTGMQKLFGGASHDNPIVLDEGTGRVYAKNNPDETRGHVSLGPTMHNTSARKGPR